MCISSQWSDIPHLLVVDISIVIKLNMQVWVTSKLPPYIKGRKKRSCKAEWVVQFLLCCKNMFYIVNNIDIYLHMYSSVYINMSGIKY